ncbi:MAG: hypothetical protein ACK5O2_12185 [Microthrixaceae bacterium]
MIKEVGVSDFVMAKVSNRYGTERSADGAANGYDFIDGPLAAALLEFRHFAELPEAAGPSVRTLNVLDPFFGPVVFTGVLVGDGMVEIADFADDPEYWELVRRDPID